MNAVKNKMARSRSVLTPTGLKPMGVQAVASHGLSKPHVADDVRLDVKEIQEGSQAFDDWHWGIPAQRVMDWGDDDYPRMLVECGRLIRLHIRTPDMVEDHPRRRRDSMIEFSRNISDNSHLAYDPSHPNQRLYLLIDPRACETLANRFWRDNKAPAMYLADIARIAGGRHGKSDYKPIKAKIMGICTGLVYKTHKKGDENPHDPRSFYIHQLGELSHHYPIPCCDEKGRIWLVGGNYTCPTPGITD